MDEFLGQVTLPLNEMDAYERPRARWYKLQSKPGKDKKDKERGDLEVRVAFTVKAGSLTDLSKKEKNKSSTLGLGGSLLSLNTLEKRKSLKKFAKSIGSKMHISSKKKDKDTDSISSSISSLSMTGSNRFDDRRFEGSQARGDADPGVISEDDDEFAFDNLSKSSASSINLKSKTLQNAPLAPSPLVRQSYSSSFANVSMGAEDDPPRNTDTPQKPEIAKRQLIEVDDWEAKLYGKNVDAMTGSLKRRSWEPQKRVEQPNPFDEEAEDKQSITHSNPFDEEMNTNPFDDRSQIEIINSVPDKRPEDSYELSSTLPREATHKEKKEKSEKRFTNKLKYFRKDKDKDKHNDTLDEIHLTKNTQNQQRQFGERIIIGHENEIHGNKIVEVPPALLKKYDGKSREVS